MRAARFGAAAAMALAGSAAAAQDKGDFCSELRRVMGAAREVPAFASLERAPPELGFDGGGCMRIAAGIAPGYRCFRNLAPDGFSRDSLAAQTRACLPDATEVEGHGRAERRFEHDDFDLAIHESGTDRAHVGRMVRYTVTLRR